MAAHADENPIGLARLLALRAGWRRSGLSVVFTGGDFERLDRGHVEFLRQARRQGDLLVVGVRGDGPGVAGGPGGPLAPAADRAAVLAALAAVDWVTVFEEATPARLVAALEPDVLVEGGGQPVEQVAGAAGVLARGGRVLSLPLVPDPSTAGPAERRPAAPGPAAPGRPAGPAGLPAGRAPDGTGWRAGLLESIEVKRRLLADCGEAIERGGRLLADTLRGGGKVLLFGNGGSAAEAQHIAAELVGRFQRERRALPALALTTDTSALTALGNDYGFERVFARQVEALAHPGDAVVALSTSGASANVLAAVAAARERTCAVLGITGAGGARLAGLCDVAVVVPSRVTSRVQEASLTVGHLWCEIVEACLDEAREP